VTRLADNFDYNTMSEYVPELFTSLAAAGTLEQARRTLQAWLDDQEATTPESLAQLSPNQVRRRGDCLMALRSLTRATADAQAGFSTCAALWDLARGRSRPDLGPGFFAEFTHLFWGITGRPLAGEENRAGEIPGDLPPEQASRLRSRQLDELWQRAEQAMERFSDGLDAAVVSRRRQRRQRILSVLGGSERDWNDWKWQARHVLTSPEKIASVINIPPEQKRAIARANQFRIPVGVTPYYASLIDEQASRRDLVVRAQVLPPAGYVDIMAEHRDQREFYFDFMEEHYTSPIERITRRYPAICILKPYNSCPQICVYCQRNWEIEQPLAPGALVRADQLAAALEWIERSSAIREVLITGGDPLVLGNSRLRRLLERLAAIDHIDMVRIGSRIPVTLPMRIDDELARLLGSFREPGRRELCLVTHVQSPYEVTPELVAAIDRLRRQGLSVLNQQVYTFHVSRRFEAARLRQMLRRVGIAPYYTFVAKGKEETLDYLVPLPRLLQERQEESRLLPGTRRTDDVVINLPRLGKTPVLSRQQRTLLAINGAGARVYELHPWEKRQRGYLFEDVPILDYLQRLANAGEDVDEYATIWYYF